MKITVNGCGNHERCEVADDVEAAIKQNPFTYALNVFCFACLKCGLAVRHKNEVVVDMEAPTVADIVNLGETVLNGDNKKL